MIHILHLCSYYAGSSVYRNLTKELDSDPRVGEQYFFIPVRSKSDLEKNKFRSANLHYFYKKCLNPFTRLSYSYKQLRIIFSFFSSSETRRFLKQSNVVHAHTLYADGLLAFVLKKLFKKPYVVTIRGTDVNYGFRFYRLWKPLAKLILRNAAHVYFVSPRHLEISKRSFSGSFRSASVLPNGIDYFWIENRKLKKNKNNDKQRKALYVGALTKNKNIKNSIISFDKACESKNYRFSIVGGSYRDYEKTFGPLPEYLKPNISFLGHISDKETIRNLLMESDLFVMPSISETFGLTYLEAVSQCTPVIFSIGQGIDGYFESELLGYSCDPKSLESIAGAIRRANEKWPHGLNFEDRSDNPVSAFSWSNVANELISSGYSRT